MTDKILCVDDEASILAFYRALQTVRSSMGDPFHIETAASGEQGLEAVATQGPFAVILSDLHMPRMNGVQFLSRVRDLSPESVRMLLTGNADVDAAIHAVNEGNIYHFLTKPCPLDTLAKALRAGIEQYRLITAEKVLLEETLRGSIQVLTEMQSLVNPVAFGRARRVQRIVQGLAKLLQVQASWQLEVAALLSQIGCLTVPEPVLTKIYQGTALAANELSMFERHPQIGHDLIRKIPRLETVAEIIAYQEKRFDGQGPPVDGKSGMAIPLGARILKVALDFEGLESREGSKAIALEHLMYRRGWYDPIVLEALERLPWEEACYARQVIPVSEMHCGMILGEDVMGITGITFVRKGQEITEALLHRLRNLSAHDAIQEPIPVLVVSTCPKEDKVGIGITENVAKRRSVACSG